MDDQLAANRANWDDRVPIHMASRFYDVAGWSASERLPSERERALIGDVTAKSLVQLQCHIGLETLQWARAGARVTGVDFSRAAIDAARSLAARTGLSSRATFVCSDVYEADVALDAGTFDIVYVSIGSLGWLPEVRRWAKVVANLLAPGGTFFIHDVHPFSSCLDDQGERIVYGYFEEPGRPFVSDDDSTYTDGASLANARSYEWNHSLGEIVQALRDEGLVIDELHEHDWTYFQQYPWLVEDHGTFRIPEGRPRLPLTFTLLAHAPGARAASTD
ncbi:MAG: class I SAM-dependent methyltransferase [Acidimicrobiales bacterium]